MILESDFSEDGCVIREFVYIKLRVVAVDLASLLQTFYSFQARTGGQADCIGQVSIQNSRILLQLRQNVDVNAI